MFKPLKNNSYQVGTTSTTSISKNDVKNMVERVVRSLWYLLGLVLLTMVTILILFAFFTSHWQKTASGLITNNEFYTDGLWWSCRHVVVSWLNSEDVYCAPINNDSTQVFYTLGTFLNLVSLFASMIGLCMDSETNKVAVPSFVMWTLIVSSIFQLIAICVYGGKGIRDYTYYEADYSIIISSVALGFNCVCVGLFMVEVIKSSDNSKNIIS